ncbi:MAG: flippase-like domain-containing protein [Deltaproteobacteria bacterium]|nr:flippase-like domain-containing protein [Deltaproteobacteria bacterium]
MSSARSRFRRNALIVVGCGVGLAFFYLAFRDISWGELVDGFNRMKPLYLVPSLLLFLVVQMLRALRFGLIVSPFCRPGAKAMWDLTNIWAGLNILMPARLAEFVRPYLLRQCGASFSSGFGAVLVERFFDLSGLLTLLGVVLWGTPHLAGKYSQLGGVLLAFLAVMYALILLILARKDSVQALSDRLLARLPHRAASFLGGILHRLIEGFRIMASPWQALFIFLCSVSIWLTFAAITYLFLVAFSIEVPFLAAITIQVLLCFGVALPSAPGFIGTFHAVGRYALTIFGVAAALAVSFATVYHLFNLVASVLIATISYLTGGFRFDQGIFGSGETDCSEGEESLPHATSSTK